MRSDFSFKQHLLIAKEVWLRSDFFLITSDFLNSYQSLRACSNFEAFHNIEILDTCVHLIFPMTNLLSEILRPCILYV